MEGGGGGHPELSQLQRQLNEGIGARPALLDQTLPKLMEQVTVEVHVVGDPFG